MKQTWSNFMMPYSTILFHFFVLNSYKNNSNQQNFWSIYLTFQEKINSSKAENQDKLVPDVLPYWGMAMLKQPGLNTTNISNNIGDQSGKRFGPKPPIISGKLNNNIFIINNNRLLQVNIWTLFIVNFFLIKAILVFIIIPLFILECE